MDWVALIQNNLAERAHSHFAPKQVDITMFEEYVKLATHITDWDNEFIRKTYEIYEAKIHVSAKMLVEKMGGEVVESKISCLRKAAS
ncbi:MAG: hypothetical protein M3Q97_01465 [Bacteroidota bacterium]|nr:hypothetical protein [Bacteroidota bacterium]